jgi:hypothetical protein
LSRYTINNPTSNGDAIKFQTILSGVSYRFCFEYCLLDDSWFMRLEDAAGVPIIAGARCVVAYPLNVRVTDQRKPIGRLVLVDTSGKNLDPGRDDLFGRVKLCYDDLTGA